jgi:hypothetical protein
MFETSSVDDALAFPFKASEKLYEFEIASTAHRATTRGATFVFSMALAIKSFAAADHRPFSPPPRHFPTKAGIFTRSLHDLALKH